MIVSRKLDEGIIHIDELPGLVKYVYRIIDHVRQGVKPNTALASERELMIVLNSLRKILEDIRLAAFLDVASRASV